MLYDFGALGRVYRETDEMEANPGHIARGEFNRPSRVVVFNVDEGWSRDVSAEIARPLRTCDDQGRSLSRATREFLEHHLPAGRGMPRESLS